MYECTASDYLEWLLMKIEFEKTDWGNYICVLNRMLQTEFKWSIMMDENRAYDGLYLRDTFCNHYGFSEEQLGYSIGMNCSVLEMMIALAYRWEDDIMYNPDFGSRYGNWFDIMFENLGLKFYTNENYDEDEVDDILENFMNRSYVKSGQGNLFVVRNPKIDIREIEIWGQLNYFIDENFVLNG